MVSSRIPLKNVYNTSFYSYLIHNIKKEKKIKFLYVIKKPKKIIRWFTTNPEIAEDASRRGSIVTCKSIKNRIIK